MSGVVYVVAADEGGPCKIGVTRAHITVRLRELQRGSPVRLNCFGAYDVVAGPHRAERDAHHVLADRRLWGEWFDLGVKDARRVVEGVVAAHNGRLQALRSVRPGGGRP